MTLGEKIQFYRKQNKYSQEKIAELLGISRQAVTKWESNQSAPNTDNLLKLASIYGISLDELINDKKEFTIDKQKPTNTKRAKKVAIIWGTLIAILMVAFILTKNSWLWIFINLIIVIGFFIIGIYIVILLVKALNKYIHTT